VRGGGQTVNEVIKKNSKFNTFKDLQNFCAFYINNNNIYKEISDKMIIDLKEKVYGDIEFMKLVVNEETHRLLTPNDIQLK
jgi:hypothetical protein